MDQPDPGAGQHRAHRASGTVGPLSQTAPVHTSGTTLPTSGGSERASTLPALAEPYTRVRVYLFTRVPAYPHTNTYVVTAH